MTISHTSQHTTTDGERVSLESEDSIIRFNRSGWLVFLFLFGLVGCAVGPDTALTSPNGDGTQHIYKFYAGNLLPHEKLAILEMTEADFAVIDGYRVDRNDYYTVHLIHGDYLIGVGKLHHAYHLTDPDVWRHVERKGVGVTFQAGHSYELYATEGVGIGMDQYFWIIDSASGELIAGEKEP